MRDGRPTVASVESEKARHWVWRAGVDFARVCDSAGLDGERLRFTLQDVIYGGGWRRRARRTVSSRAAKRHGAKGTDA